MENGEKAYLSPNQCTSGIKKTLKNMVSNKKTRIQGYIPMWMQVIVNTSNLTEGQTELLHTIETVL